MIFPLIPRALLRLGMVVMAPTLFLGDLAATQAQTSPDEADKSASVRPSSPPHPSRTGKTKGGTIADIGAAASTRPSSPPHPSQTGKARSAMITEIGASAFPYDGPIPETGDTPFLGRGPDGRAFHVAPRGGKLYADSAYADRRSLLFIPSGFDIAQPAAIVLFMHGNLATLARDVERRQRVPEQLEASKLNAVLVAPQLAVDALDSSAGHFWTPGFLDIYLRDAARQLATMSAGRLTADQVDRLPVIIVAYSGGYLATAFSLKYASPQGRARIKGVLLLDALFGEEAKFADWIVANHERTFFVSAFSRSSADLNTRLAKEVEGEHIAVRRSIPAQIASGEVVFQAALNAVHNDFVTQAYARDPLRDLLSRISLVPPRPRSPAREGGPFKQPATAESSDMTPADSPCPADAPIV